MADVALIVEDRYEEETKGVLLAAETLLTPTVEARISRTIETCGESVTFVPVTRCRTLKQLVSALRSWRFTEEEDGEEEEESA